MHIVENPCQAVGRQQKPKWLYNLSAPSVSYKIFLCSHKGIRGNLPPAADIYSDRTYVISYLPKL
jgi:hypothetical protein